MSEAKGSRLKLLLAFAIVYIVWGSTYLGIRYAIETIPPMLMAGTRFLAAGLILYAWSALKGAARPRLAEWRTALILGALLILVGNGGVTIAEQHLSSGLAALLVASEPLWLVLLAWAKPGGRAPSRTDVIGLAFGFVGVGLLVAPWEGGAHSNGWGVLVVLVAAFSWAAGSIYSTTAPQSASRPMANGMIMMAGGGLQLLAGLARGEAGAVRWEAMSATSLWALAYLALFGSLLAFSAYTYLLSATTPAKASTYAFVNPAVAVLLGWAIAGEPLTLRMVLASVAIVAGVVLLTLGHAGPQPAAQQAAKHEEDAEEKAALVDA